MAKHNAPTIRYCFNCRQWIELDEKNKDSVDLLDCPRCRQKQRMAKCVRCGSEWEVIRARYPERCPKCKSDYYNKKRIQERSNIAKSKV